jgi:hypothetical protein
MILARFQVLTAAGMKMAVFLDDASSNRYVTLGHDRFLQRPFQFTIHHHSTLCNQAAKTSLNKQVTVMVTIMMTHSKCVGGAG